MTIMVERFECRNSDLHEGNNSVIDCQFFKLGDPVSNLGQAYEERAAFTLFVRLLSRIRFIKRLYFNKGTRASTKQRFLCNLFIS